MLFFSCPVFLDFPTLFQIGGGLLRRRGWWGGGGGRVVGFIKVGIGVIPRFFYVYASTTKFNVIDFIYKHPKYTINVKIEEFY